MLQGEREMAAYNKTLGRFSLNNIPPAPRGVPQIQVSFDIDANGIVKVTAKDLGTGQQQDITITSSTNLSDDDIEKAVKEAEQFAAEDKKRKEEVDVRNNADNMVYQTEKTLGEIGDKIDAAEKSAIQAEVDKLKELLKASPIDCRGRKGTDRAVSQKFYAVSESSTPQHNRHSKRAGTGRCGSRRQRRRRTAAGRRQCGRCRVHRG